MESVDEVWKPVKGYEEIYEVSNMGRVRSLDRMCKVIGMASRSHRGRVLCHKVDADGYSLVSLCVNNKACTRRVHRLVCDAFISPLVDGLEVNHKDLDKSNNRADNLEQCTSKFNSSHSAEHGRHPHGERARHAKLRDDDVASIRDYLSIGLLTCREIGLKFGVCEETVRLIKVGHIWKRPKTMWPEKQSR